MNIMNALFMVASALLAGVALAGGLSIPGLFLVLGIANMGVVILAFRYRQEEL